ncbi:MAG: glutathione S-transferase N-terminal domain-containing protein [Pseudomonadota bacterium]
MPQGSYALPTQIMATTVSVQKPYILYNRLGSGGFVAEAVLELAELPYKLNLLESTPSTPLPSSFHAINPWGQVPVLETPERDVITELAAMLLYLAATHSSVTNGPNLRVMDRAAFYRWTVFLSVNIYEGTLRRSYPERYLAQPHKSDAGAIQSVKAAAFARNHQAFQLIEEQLCQPRGLCGEGLSPADIFLAMLYAWHNERPDLPNCTAMTETVANHPIVRPIWFRNFDHRLDKKWTSLPDGTVPG